MTYEKEQHRAEVILKVCWKKGMKYEHVEQLYDNFLLYGDAI